MNIKPHTIRILGVTHNIEYMEGNPGDHDEWGSYDANTRTIKVNATHDDFERWHIIIHEVFHALEDKLKLSRLTTKMGHEELDLFAYGMTEVLFSNGFLTHSDDIG